MKVSIIIPSFNEGRTLKQIVKKVLAVKIPHSKEVIVVNDGSTDETRKILSEFKISFFDRKRDHFKFQILEHKQNKGKGTAIRTGLKHATGDIILTQDADLEYDPQDIPKLLLPLKDKKVNVVYGSRVLGKNPISHWTFNLGGRLVTFVTNLLYGTNITDEPTGYKVFRSKILKNLKLKSKGFEFCPEVTAKIAKKGMKIFEVPIKYNPRPISEKKIKWQDGFKAIYYLLKYRFTS